MKGRLRLAFLLTLAFAVQAQAETVCEAIFGAKIEQPNLALPGTNSVATCKTSLALGGGSQLHCGWPFEYRNSEATVAFEALIAAVESCLGPDATITADQDVNHPDFYDLRTFAIAGQTIGVSLKDKAALSETYVFLRIATD